MATSPRCGLTLAFLLLGAVTDLRAQQYTDLPLPFKPRRHESRAELDRREARVLFAQGLICQREDRLVEAMHSFEQARTLDSKAAAIHRALVPIYLGLGRSEDALSSCRKVLELEPGDHETWYMYSRELYEQGDVKEATAALERAVACPNAQEHLELLVQMQYELGIAHQDAKNYAAAEKAFRDVIKVLVDRRETLLEDGPFEPEQLDRETSKTFERIGEVCTAAEAYDRAVVAFTQAQKRDPERAGRLGYNLARVYLAQKKPTEALRQLDVYLQTQPQSAEPYELKISLLKKLARDADVLPALEQAAARDEYNVALHLLLAREYGRENKLDDAEKLYQKLAETNPNKEVYQGLFGLYKDQGSPRKVLDLLDQTLRTAGARDDGADDDAAPTTSAKASAAAARGRGMLIVLRDDPALVKAVLKEAGQDLLDQRPRYRSTLRYLALLAARTKQLTEAEALYRKCLTMLTPQTEGEVYGGLLDVLMDQRKYQEVVALCEKGQKNAQATNLLIFSMTKAPALVYLGKNDDAIAAADEAVKLADDGNRLSIQRRRIEILRLAEQYDKAIEQAEALLKEYSRPGQVRDIRLTLSNIYSSRGDQAKSEEQLRLVLDADPNDAGANNDLGYQMADQNKNLEEAEKMIRKAIDLDMAEKKRGKALGLDGEEANAAYIDSLGWVLFRLGKLEEASRELEKATKLTGGDDDPVVWDHLGDVYFKMDRTKQAAAAWQKAIKLFDEDRRRKTDDRYKDIQQKLEKLGKQKAAR